MTKKISIMKSPYTLPAFAIFTATIYAVAVIKDWLSIVIYCENFGCLGKGLYYILIAIVIVIGFFIVGWFLAPKQKFKSMLLSGTSSFLAMWIAFVAIGIANQISINDSIKRHEEACIEYPVLCPEGVD